MAETPTHPIRAPRALWDAYRRVCTDRDTTATADLIDHMIRTIRRHGDDETKRMLTEGLADLDRNRPGPKRPG